jgi:hypothetical protein
MTRWGTAAVVLLCAGTLAACSDGDSGDSGTPPGFTPAASAPATTSGTAASPTRGAAPDAATDVDVADYTTGNLVSWSLEGAGVACSVNTAPRSDYADCTLDFTDDIRDRKDPRFAAGAVLWIAGEGFRPAMQTGGGEPTDHPVLHPGQRISAAGVTCTATGPRGMTCGRDGQEFRYDDGDFSATGWDGPGSRTIVDGSKTRGQFCGRANNGLYADLAVTDVVVTKGTVDCADAVGTFDAYLATWQDGSRGNTLLTPLDNGWTCSFPTAKRSEDEDVTVSCGTGDGRGVKIPRS